VTEKRLLAAGFVVCVVLGSVLRLTGLSFPPTLFDDESYSAYAASLPIGDIPSYVRKSDPHPPLFYLILAPVERVSTSETALRIPSAVMSALALLLMALWQRRRGVEGLLVTFLFAIIPFQTYFARQARMYGLMELAGVAGAMAADRWLTSRRRGWIAVAAVAGLAAALSQAIGFLLLGGLLLVPWLRRDRAALEWRLGMLGSGVVYAGLWGITAYRLRGTSLYDRVTLNSALTTINEMVAAVPGNRYLTVAVLCAGGVLLFLRRSESTAWVYLTMFALPVAGAAVVALRVPMFIPKTLVVLSWGVPIAMAAIVMRLGKIHVLAGGLAMALLLLLIVPYIGPTLRSFDRTG
jgi:mannosyltransferase